MDRNFIASELLEAARDLTAIGERLTRNVDVGRRNVDVHPSNTSFAPAISAKLRKKAVEGLESHNRELDLNPSDLKRVWSAYYSYIDPRANNNKYHYYVVYSFEHLDSDTRYVGWNCSGRIGILERAYDLTLKYGRNFPAYSVNEAKAAIDKHLRVKTRKGYTLEKMTRG